MPTDCPELPSRKKLAKTEATELPGGVVAFEAK